jgi:kynurenine formamidase
MTILDLSQSIYHGMPVYPGDPEVEITTVSTVAKDEWAVSGIKMVTHDGTHLNVPRHISNTGKTLSDYNLADFIAETKVYKNNQDIEPGLGVIFVDHPIDMRVAKVIAKKKPKLVGLSDEFDFNLDAEKFLLEQGIISYEKLANCKRLPKDKSFMFYGIPLNIKDSDGSPVRAFVIVE